MNPSLRRSKAPIQAVALAALALISTSCASLRPGGLLLTDVAYPVTATANIVGNRVGEACSQTFLFLVTVGDASIEAARRNGGITQISTVDQSFKNYGPFYGKSCTIVRGR